MEACRIQSADAVHASQLAAHVDPTVSLGAADGSVKQ
jgi:hypothetical protein